MSRQVKCGERREYLFAKVSERERHGLGAFLIGGEGSASGSRFVEGLQ